MGLPNQLKSARMTNSTVGSSIDENVGDAEKAVCDILGIPVDTNISAALFEVVAAGLKSIILQDASADPAVTGYIRRNGARLKFYDGTRAQDLVCIPGGGTNKVMFQQSAVPTGWTRVVDAGNTDSVPILRLNSEVPGTGGSWTISGISGAGYTLTITDLPASIYFPTANAQGTAGGGGNPSNAQQGGGAAHSHSVSSDGTWRPKYVDFCLGSKD